MVNITQQPSEKKHSDVSSYLSMTIGHMVGKDSFVTDAHAAENERSTKDKKFTRDESSLLADAKFLDDANRACDEFGDEDHLLYTYPSAGIVQFLCKNWGGSYHDPQYRVIMKYYKETAYLWARDILSHYTPKLNEKHAILAKRARVARLALLALGRKHSLYENCTKVLQALRSEEEPDVSLLEAAEKAAIKGQ